MNFSPVIIAADINCQLAENPLWDAEKQCVYWTDIPAGKIFALDYKTNQHRIVYEGEPVGGFTIQKNGDLLLFRSKDIVFLNAQNRISKLRDFSDEGFRRFNDVIADPRGRVFAGSIGMHPQGGVYRLDPNGEITKLFTGTGISNGMGFSPDLTRFYWTCSTTGKIFVFKYDADTGVLSNRKVLYATNETEGIPDGLTVDADGYVWSARWGGSALVRHAPDGTPSGSIRMPIANVTSLCFGGPILDEVFVTVAQDEKNPVSTPGLFRTRTDIRGQCEFRSSICA